MRVEDWLRSRSRLSGSPYSFQALGILLDSLLLKLGYFNLRDTQPPYYVFSR
ncbi:MAG: hypothetical protein AABN95_10170 [Acidobacteriota bacterium]